MATVIRFVDRLERNKARTETQADRGSQERFRYPGPDALSEVSCFPKRRRQTPDWAPGTERRAD
jgi:hypothetical protein